MTYTNWDYVSERDIAAGEKGIIARQPIPAGIIVGIYDGLLEVFEIDKEERLKDREAHKFIVQIARSDNLLYGLIKRDGRSGIGFINHSCKANIVARDRIVLVAERDIAAGEALTIDYTKWDFVHEGIPCWCPNPRCLI